MRSAIEWVGTGGQNGIDWTCRVSWQGSAQSEGGTFGIDANVGYFVLIFEGRVRTKTQVCVKKEGRKETAFGRDS